MNAARRRLRAEALSPIWPDQPLLSQHQAFIRALPCVACGKPAPPECAHLGIDAGLGSPSGDWFLVPLCGPASVWQDCCHSRKHYLGTARFWTELGIDPLDLAFRLWRVSGDMRAGERLVLRAQQAAYHHRDNGELGHSRVRRRSGNPVRATPQQPSLCAFPERQGSGEIARLLEGST